MENQRKVLAERKAAFDAEVLPIRDAIADTEYRVGQIEERLRNLAYDVHEQTGAKEIAPGVKVRIMSKVEYDHDEALSWARQSGVGLALDAPTFERVARISRLPFVTIREYPQVTIASDIRKALAELA